ncbi:MAG: AAA family ATPase [Gammaproteobacteria bacterium]|nr:AAA family ATPase [Gammaproteobacteria bacterium]
MYPEYFGLKRPVFSITPDPHYLYLSQQHRDALAHLLYGVQDGGGFVLLTGEVGTGKTTICRAFLEQLPDHVDVALVLNPALTAPELLHTVCDEFRIDVPGDEVSIKVLSNRLNEYLLKSHAAGRRPVLMIDEAQNLAPDVLEQIRLLTNLETHTTKLLQVFLVGQPELRELLKHQGLRQLSQRITARFHLLPLSRQETRDYILHRLSVAGTGRPLFTRGAIKRIYRLTGGIPRLINILCERTLLGAFATGKSKVNRAIVNRAKLELEGERLHSRLPFVAVTALVMLGVGAMIGWLVYDRNMLEKSTAATGMETLQAGEITRGTEPETATGTPVPVEPENSPPDIVHDPVPGSTNESIEPAKPATLPPGTGNDSADIAVAAVPEEPDLIEQAAASLPPADQSLMPESNVEKAVEDDLPVESVEEPINSEPNLVLMDRSLGLKQLLKRWIPDYPDKLDAKPCLLAIDKGLRCRKETGNWERILKLDRPVMLRLSNESGYYGFGLVLGLNSREALLDLADGKTARVPRSLLDQHWSGEYEFLWQPPPGGNELIWSRSPERDIRWLRRTMSRIPGYYPGNPDSGDFDDGLQAELMRFQKQQGLKADGLAGPETLIALIAAARLPGIPRLERIPLP